MRGCGLEMLSLATSTKLYSESFRPLVGMMFYQPPPSVRGRWRATRAGRGACDGCRFLTIERQYRSWRPYHRCAVPLPRGERGRLGLRVSVPLRGCGFEIFPMKLKERTTWSVSVPLRRCGFEISEFRSVYDADKEFPSPCGDVVLKSMCNAG